MQHALQLVFHNYVSRAPEDFMSTAERPQVSIRQHTSVYAALSIRQHTSVYAALSIRQHTSVYAASYTDFMSNAERPQVP
jgi:hypothetical protein